MWGDWGGEDLKAKNIRQTELLVDLRAAILQIGRHFQSLSSTDDSIVSICQHFLSAIVSLLCLILCYIYWFDYKVGICMQSWNLHAKLAFAET